MVQFETDVLFNVLRNLLHSLQNSTLVTSKMPVTQYCSSAFQVYTESYILNGKLSSDKNCKLAALTQHYHSWVL